MIRAARLGALAVLLALTLVACGRATSNNGPSISTVYAASVRLSDVKPALDDPDNWWPAPPTFGLRPLDIGSMNDAERFYFVQRFAHLGSPEKLRLNYQVWSTTTIAQAILSNVQSSVSGATTTPAAGDQVVYVNQNINFGPAPYLSEAVVRVGQTIVDIQLSQANGFAGSGSIGRIAKTVGSRLKHPPSGGSLLPPSTDPALLPPVGPDLTLVGTARLPVEVVAEMVDDPAPTDLVTLFNRLGASDFEYGDYVLLADTHMEVQTAAFSFSGATGATDWLNAFIGKANLDASGGYLNFDSVTGQYIAAAGVGSHGILMICRSVADLEAASRACETPISRVLDAWKSQLPA
ncbi:MAG TPA: hypothetical protein VGG31_04005 [Candidatus Dormibacteraeota bacterium]